MGSSSVVPSQPPIKFDLQLAYAATQAQGTQTVESPQVLNQHQLALSVSAVPGAGSLAIYGRTIGANDWSLITTFDMRQGSAVIVFEGFFDRYQCIPTSFDAGKTYTVVITSVSSGLTSNDAPTILVRNTIATGITVNTNIKTGSHEQLAQHQIQIDVKGTPAGSVAVSGQPLGGSPVPIGTVTLTAGNPRHLIFKGHYNSLVLAPAGLAGASVSVTLISTRTGQGYMSPVSLFSGALVYQTSVQSIPNAIETAVTFNTEVYKTLVGMHSTSVNMSRLVAPLAGHVRITGQANFSAIAAGTRQLEVFKNGARMVPAILVWPDATPAGASQYSFQIYSPVLSVAANDYFEIYVTQTSGAALSLSGNGSWAQLEYL